MDDIRIEFLVAKSKVPNDMQHWLFIFQNVALNYTIYIYVNEAPLSSSQGLVFQKTFPRLFTHSLICCLIAFLNVCLFCKRHKCFNLYASLYAGCVYIIVSKLHCCSIFPASNTNTKIVYSPTMCVEHSCLLTFLSVCLPGQCPWMAMWRCPCVRQRERKQRS